MPGLLIAAGASKFLLAGNRPAAPSTVICEATGETTTRITWVNEAVAPDNATIFRLQVSTNGGSSWSTQAEIVGTLYDHTGLTQGTSRLYRVFAVNFWGTSDPSPEVVGSTQSAGPPPQPTGLTATPVSSSVVNLSWVLGSDNDTSVELQRDISGSFSSPATITLAAHSTSYSDTGRTPETEYFYRTRALRSGVGNSSYSSTASAITLAAGAPSFSLSPVADATTGITADIAIWFAAETTRLGHAPGVNDWWLWQLLLVPALDGSGGVWLAIVQHRDPAGAKIYKNLGGFAFQDETSNLGVNSYDLTAAGGATMFWDYDGDGDADYCGFNSTYGQTEWFRNNAGTLADVGDGPQQTSGSLDWYYIAAIGNLAGNGRCDFRIINTPVQSSLTGSRFTYAANGSGWFTRSADTAPPPSGIPSGVLTDLAQYTYPTITSSFMEIRFIPFDLTGSGSPNDLIVQVFGSYDGPSGGRYLISDGAGGYIDKTTDWGLPTDAVPLIARQWAMPLREESQADAHLHLTGAGSGRPSIFCWKRPNANSVAGYYTWNGSGYSRKSDPLTTKLSAVSSEVYQAELFMIDFTNSGRLDAYLKFPRGGQGFLFLNNGSGDFSLYSGAGTGAAGLIQSWDAYGEVLYDIDNDGLIDIAAGGNASGGGVGGVSGSTAKVLTCLRNTTTDAGRWLKVKCRLSTGHNRFAVGGFIEVYPVNSSTLLRRWKCRPDGMPVHFGVSGRTTVDVKVTWPDGSVDLHEDVATNQQVDYTK